MTESVAWLTSIAAILTPFAAFLGTYVSAKLTYKSKLAEIQSHTKENIEGAFTNRLDSVDITLEDIKRAQLKTSLTVAQLQDAVKSLTTVVDKTHNLEQEIAILKTKLDLKGYE